MKFELRPLPHPKDAVNREADRLCREAATVCAERSGRVEPAARRAARDQTSS